MNVETLLRVEIEDQFVKLGSMTPGSEEHKATVNTAAALTDRLLELEKLEAETQYKENTRKFEEELKLRQAKDERLDRIVKNCISAAGVVLPICLAIWGTKTSLKFEEEGTITTTIGRGFINKLLPKK